MLFLSTFPCNPRNLSSHLEVSADSTGLIPARIALVVSTSLFEEEIIVACWELLVVVLNILRDLSYYAGVL